jgi:hypothetical protein
MVDERPQYGGEKNVSLTGARDPPAIVTCSLEIHGVQRERRATYERTSITKTAFVNRQNMFFLF